jgi:hypothetical protein
MKLTQKEDILLRRALDPASSPNEAAKAAEAFVNSLRKRGLNGYDFVRRVAPEREHGPQARPSDTPSPPPPPKRHATPPDSQWDFMREQQRKAYTEASDGDAPKPESGSQYKWNVPPPEPPQKRADASEIADRSPLHLGGILALVAIIVGLWKQDLGLFFLFLFVGGSIGFGIDYLLGLIVGRESRLGRWVSVISHGIAKFLIGAGYFVVMFLVAKCTLSHSDTYLGRALTEFAGEFFGNKNKLSPGEHLATRSATPVPTPALGTSLTNPIPIQDQASWDALPYGTYARLPDGSIVLKRQPKATPSPTAQLGSGTREDPFRPRWVDETIDMDHYMRNVDLFTNLPSGSYYLDPHGKLGRKL